MALIGRFDREGGNQPKTDTVLSVGQLGTGGGHSGETPLTPTRWSVRQSDQECKKRGKYWVCCQDTGG